MSPLAYLLDGMGALVRGVLVIVRLARPKRGPRVSPIPEPPPRPPPSAVQAGHEGLAAALRIVDDAKKPPIK